jgi:hypothetical protein
VIPVTRDSLTLPSLRQRPTEQGFFCALFKVVAEMVESLQAWHTGYRLAVKREWKSPVEERLFNDEIQTVKSARRSRK